jgi:dinuclear metal center YbgI/SA1388 family protein
MSALPLGRVVEWLDRLLDPTRIEDYGPNGLQVEASSEVRRVVTGVTANLAFIEAAAARGADLAVVHHGLYWSGSPATATGALGRRLKTLFAHGLSLAAYHLPLDAHLEVGNAAGLARALGLDELSPGFAYRGAPTGVIGRFSSPLPAAALPALLARGSPRALVFGGGPPAITTVGIVTGGAPRVASEAARLGLDLYVTGEASEYTQATAREEHIHIAACGHHRTEVFGPRALAERLTREFPSLEVAFVDIDNPA